MTHQDDLQPKEQPAMELLDGAEQAAPVKSPLMRRLARGTLYSVLLLSASALLAISAVPELAKYATFIPDAKYQVKDGSHCSSQSSACTALNVATLEGSPCCPHSEAKIASTDGCSLSCGDEASVASASGCSSTCKISETLASLAAGAGGKFCCQDEGSTTDVQVVDDAPAPTLLTDEQLALLPEGEDLD